MTPLGRRCALAACAIGVVLFGTWDHGVAPAADRPLDGEQVFRARACATCHTGPDHTSDLGASFPSLADAPRWAGDRRPGMTAEDYIAESITSPGAFVSPAFRGGADPTAAMPQLSLTPAEIDAVVAYLLTPG